MGASNVPAPPSEPPVVGYQIVYIPKESIELSHKMNLFTDFLITNPKSLDFTRQNIELNVFSILNYSMRKQTLPISNRQIGVKLKMCKIRDNILKITKVFNNSPCEHLGVIENQYIVAIENFQYDNLNQFATVIKSLMTNKTQFITLGICNQDGQTRMVPFSSVVLNEWKKNHKNKGILGCEIAEGWANRFQKIISNSKQQKKSRQTMKQIIEEEKPKSRQQYLEELKNLKKQSHDDSLSEGQVEAHVSELEGIPFTSQTVEIEYKGILKNERLDDASTICKCKPYSRHCEKCFMEKDGVCYFFNKKANKIIGIQRSMLFKI